MLPGAELGTRVCAAFDAFANAPKVPGCESWRAFVDRTYATLLRDDPGAFDALFWVLATKSSSVHQNLAGTLLVQFNVPCSIGLDAFLEALLHNFDASAKETVRYLTRVFGREAVIAKVRVLQEYDLTERERGTIDSLRNHLGEHVG